MINSKEIWGGEFRVPSIVGEGSGHGFHFKDLHLPKRWKEAKIALKSNPLELQAYFESICTNLGTRPGTIEAVKIDEETTILKRIAVESPRFNSTSSLEMADFPFLTEGRYQGKNIQDIRSAIALQRVVGSWLYGLWEELEPKLSDSFALIEGSTDCGYNSPHLAVPKEFLNSSEPLTSQSFRDCFVLNASNIAGRFGTTLHRIKFDTRGIPTDLNIENDYSGYKLQTDGRYSGRTRDPYQAAALHGIGASFINHLLERAQIKAANDLAT